MKFSLLTPVLIENIPGLSELGDYDVLYLDHKNKRVISSTGSVFIHKICTYKFITTHLNMEIKPQIPQVPNININTAHMEKELYSTKEFFDKEKESND